MPPVLSALEAWQNFYVIIGSSAGALTGLQFVVVALVSDMPDPSGFTRTSATFATPTVVHFGAVLVLSGLFSAPWPSVGSLMVVVGIAGIVGLGYTVSVARRVRKMTEYVPVFEDWLTHVLLPVAAYLVLVIAALEGASHPAVALFAMAAAAMVLLVVGIHNAWDSVTYIVVMRGNQEKARHGRDRHR